MILAFDLGTKLGWATDVNGSVVSGTDIFAVDRFNGGGMRYLKFARWLDFIKDDATTEVWFEEVRRHAGTTAAHVYGGFLAVITAWCEKNELPYQGVPVGTLKKFWCGKGNASKQQMIDECIKRGLNPVDDNEADAIAILMYALEQKG